MSFFDANGQPIHEFSYCIFLDVLGFTGLIASADQPNELLQQYYSVAVQAIDNLRWVDRFPGVNIKVFTDNIVIGIPWNDIAGDGEAELGTAMMVLPQYQLEMALAGFFVRGGFSLGPLFMDDNIVFGEALIEAYTLESTTAVVPRIVLGGRVASVVNEHIGYYFPPDDSPQNRQILQDSDNRMFVNYLEATFDAEGNPNWLQLETHKDNVIAAIESSIETTQVWLKYQWLCSYHNYFCEQLTGFSEYSDHIQIPNHHFQRVPSTIVNP